jgi:hypothetical protein
MKYRDVISLFVGIGFVLSLAYSIGVAKSVWFWIVPILLLVTIILVIWKLWL